jgi:anti-anti-sigma factor
MKLWEKKKEGIVILAIEGRLDAQTAPLFEEQVMPMLDGAEKNFLLDLARLDYISSAALRRLLVLAKRVEGKGGRVALLSLQGHILEIFELSGFSQLFPIYADQEEALRSF